MLPSQLQELEVKPQSKTALSESETEMSDPLSPARLAISRCIELAYRRGCEIEELELRAKKEAKEDRILGKMLIAAEKQGLERVVFGLEQVWIRWNFNKSTVSCI